MTVQDFCFLVRSRCGQNRNRSEILLALNSVLSAMIEDFIDWQPKKSAAVTVAASTGQFSAPSDCWRPDILETDDGYRAEKVDKHQVRYLDDDTADKPFYYREGGYYYAVPAPSTESTYTLHYIGYFADLTAADDTIPTPKDCDLYLANIVADMLDGTGRLTKYAIEARQYIGSRSALQGGVGPANQQRLPWEDNETITSS